MKASRYNRWVDLPTSSRLLFNSRSAALVEIDCDQIPVIRRLLDHPESAANATEKEYVEGLTYGKFLIADEAEELVQMKAQNRLRRFHDAPLFLTIAPTLACNFACRYCYENTGGKSMDADTERALLDFAQKRLIGASGLMVTWFGGEPTLCLPTVLRIQRRLAEFASAQGVKMDPTGIVTNGYCLDRKAAEQLASVGIVDTQVTLDGPPAIHDQRRPLRNGEGTFHRIIDNLREAVDFLHITVRINVDHDSLSQAGDVMAELDRAGLLSRLGVYFAPVMGTDGVCADIVGRCFSGEQFASAQVSLYQALLDSGHNCIDYPTLAPAGHCGADSANAWVVAPNGLLFKCWEELSLNPDKSVGSLHSDQITSRQQANLDRYMAWDAFDKPGCIGCDVLPLCMGGCPIQGIKKNSNLTGSCNSWKYNLGDMLKLRYLLENRKEVNP